MKIKFGAIVTDGRGKLGGHVASKNRSGSYLRTKVTPSNPQSIRQTEVRNLLGFWSGQWSIITDADRASFNAAVVEFSSTNIFGDIKNPTGKNLFTKLNINAGGVDYSIVNPAPSKTEFPEFFYNTMTIDISANTITFDGSVGDGLTKMTVASTGKLSAGTFFTKGKFRNLQYVTDDVTTATNFWGTYVARFGVPVLGDNISFQFKLTAENGQTTVPVVLKATVIA